MGRIGMGEIIVVALVVIVLFGAKKLPEIGEALGSAIRKFKKTSKDVEDSLDDTKDHKNLN